VCAVAKWGLGRCLAAAKKELFVSLGGKFDWRNARPFVRAIAKWLFSTFATGAPEIGFACFHFDRHRGLLGNNGISHILGPQKELVLRLAALNVG
jgi:hypothetical protein